jgi:hypothetical protein
LRWSRTVCAEMNSCSAISCVLSPRPSATMAAKIAWPGRGGGVLRPVRHPYATITLRCSICS